ncbi:MAG TPA: hypothetical protein GX506_05700 [Firmicutes bacterium]|nr:hypothetical protein [Bacillota bacterium]
MRKPNFMVAISAAMLVSILFIGNMAGTAATVPSTVELPDKLPKAEPPVVVTTLGQSPGALMVRMLCNSVKLKCDEKDLLTAEELLAASKKKDTAYKTLIITMGTSLKGMGAAGIDIESEVKRVQAVIDTARKLGILIIGAQIEGPSRRVDEYDEKSIRTVTPQSDLLIIRKDINKDGYFSNTAKEKHIPIVFITQAMDLTHVLKVLFSL